MRDNDLSGAWQLLGEEPWEGGSPIGPIPCQVPGDALCALEEAGIVRPAQSVQDQRALEWVSRRAWHFSTVYTPPQEPYEGRSERHHLHIRAAGAGVVRVDGQQVGIVEGPWVESALDVTRFMEQDGPHSIQVELDKPIEDPVPRAGILSARVRSTAFCRIEGARATGAQGGIDVALRVGGTASGRITCRYRVLLGDELIASHDVQEKLIADMQEYSHRIPAQNLLPWRDGAVYAVRLTIERGGARCDTAQFYAAASDFRFVPLPGAPGALPYALRLDGRLAFLRGINLAPPVDVRDLTSAKEAGANLIRFTGPMPPDERALCACDRLGLIVWQELPFDPQGAAAFSRQLAAHPCAGAVSIGHRLTGPDGAPIGLTHPAIYAMREAVLAANPSLAFFPSSPSGPVGFVEERHEGRGLCHDAHGPLSLGVDLCARMDRSDALLYGKIGFPALSDAFDDAPLAGELRALTGDIQPEPLRRISLHLQAEALRYCALSARRRGPSACAGMIAWLGNQPHIANATHGLCEFGGRERPALRALARAWSPVAASATLDKLHFLRGETLDAQLHLHVPPQGGGLYAVTAKLCDLRGNALAEENRQLLAKDTVTDCGALRYRLPADAPDILLLLLSVHSGEQELFSDCYVLPIPHEGQPPFSPLARLPAARPSAATRDGRVQIANDGPDAALGVCVWAEHKLLYYGSLLPWERRPLAVPEGTLSDALRIEALGDPPDFSAGGSSFHHLP